MAQVIFAPGGKDPGFVVTGGTIRMSRAGAWTADITIDADAVPTGAAELRIAGRRVLRGTILRASLYGGMVRARLAAGGAGLRKVLEPRHFTAPSVRVVIAEIVRQAGETISAQADATMLSTLLEHWTLRRMEAGAALVYLLDRLPVDTGWRILDDGTLWIGPEKWPASGVTGFTEIARTPEDEVISYGLEMPYLQPGTLLDGRKVDATEITITPGKIGAVAWTAP